MWKDEDKNYERDMSVRIHTTHSQQNSISNGRKSQQSRKLHWSKQKNYKD